MKRLIPLLSAALMISACSTPEERARADAAERRRESAERQSELEEEARENFRRERESEAERRRELDEDRRDAAEEAGDRSRDVAQKRRESAEAAARYRAYETEYARQIGKRPSQLTPSERAWVRENFD